VAWTAAAAYVRVGCASVVVLAVDGRSVCVKTMFRAGFSSGLLASTYRFHDGVPLPRVL